MDWNIVELDWSEPFLVSGVECCTAKHDRWWLICSLHKPGNPRFCLSAKTKTAAIKTAKRAIEFWHRSPKKK